MTIAIEPYPWRPETPATIRLNNSATIAVAILSTTAFDARQVDPASVTFGRTGNEPSLRECVPGKTDVNHDGLTDLVCHFDNRLTRFQAGDNAGILRGLTFAKVPVEGKAPVLIVK